MDSRTVTNANKEETIIEMPPTEIHCPNCGAEYTNIQHPLKASGVIIQRQCKCKLEFESDPSGTTTFVKMVPPTEKD